MNQSSTTPFEDSLASSQDTAFLGYPASQDLISTADSDNDQDLSFNKAKFTSGPRTSSERPQLDTGVTLLVGLDLGTSRTCIQLASAKNDASTLNTEIPTVVGYARSGILPGILPENRTVFFGDEALAHKLHLDLVYPLQNGVITNFEAARDFLNHVRSRIGTSEDTELRVVIGLPSKAGEKAREDLSLAATRIFDRVILIPEPFLAALGSRESNANSDTSPIPSSWI